MTCGTRWRIRQRLQSGDAAQAASRLPFPSALTELLSVKTPKILLLSLSITAALAACQKPAENAAAGDAAKAEAPA